MPLFRWGKYIDKKIGELESGEASARAVIESDIRDLDKQHSEMLAKIKALEDAPGLSSEAEGRIATIEEWEAGTRERIDALQTDHDQRIEKLEQWSKEGFAPGAFSEIAKLRPLIEEQDALLDSTRDIALDSATDLKALRSELQEEGDDLAKTLHRMAQHIVLIAAELHKIPGMSQPVAAQPPRPVLLDIAERPAVRKRS